MMKDLRSEKCTENIDSYPSQSINSLIESAMEISWSKIAPFWPLKNLIAVNPISGLEDLPFEVALQQAQVYFQQSDLPKGMLHVNRQTIKWLQVFFDEGQSTIHMPNRHLGLLQSVLILIRFDHKVHEGCLKKKDWLNSLSQDPTEIIMTSLIYLGIESKDYEIFFILLLTTLPGWASHIQYRANWADNNDKSLDTIEIQRDYLALRLVLTCLCWPEAKELLKWHEKALKKSNTHWIYKLVVANEQKYQESLVNKIMAVNIKPGVDSARIEAQILFCIDVRSEPLRRAIEAQGCYETYGLAGFFGLPVAIKNIETGMSYASCPVLLKPKHCITEHPLYERHSGREGHNRLRIIKKLYQSMKYTFAAPFSLVDMIGLAHGVWMGLKTFIPGVAVLMQGLLKSMIASDYEIISDIESIPFDKKIEYGENALRAIGLTKNFAPLVVLCGHGSSTENNAYATALDCGACGGHHGGSNARILSQILNDEDVRKALNNLGIEISKETQFLSAEHNTTTDEVALHPGKFSEAVQNKVDALTIDLQKARASNNLCRSGTLGEKSCLKSAQKNILCRSHDWAQIRPEWGLAKNASFIIGPRWLTKNIDLEGRSFLHSYEWESDHDLSVLTAILTAPMIVTQWINAQYFFSTLDNIAFGGGSKVTQNIVGKIGVMQGNASDLMHGLPLQSVYKSDTDAYHELVRMTVVVYAPKSYISMIIPKFAVLQRLFTNGWINMICYDSLDRHFYRLERSLRWEKIL